MQKNKIKRMLMSIVAFFILCTPASVYGAEEWNAEQYIYQAEPKTADYIWKYRMIDGKTYKRRFNVRTGKFVGDWILA